MYIDGAGGPDQDTVWIHDKNISVAAKGTMDRAGIAPSDAVEHRRVPAGLHKSGHLARIDREITPVDDRVDRILGDLEISIRAVTDSDVTMHDGATAWIRSSRSAPQREAGKQTQKDKKTQRSMTTKFINNAGLAGFF